MKFKFRTGDFFTALLYHIVVMGIIGPIPILISDIYYKKKDCLYALQRAFIPGVYWLAVIISCYSWMFFGLLELSDSPKPVEMVICIFMLALNFALEHAFFDKDKFFLGRLKEMIKNKKIVAKMKEYYPLNPKTKFRIEWLMPSYYTTVMFLFKNDIDPSVMEDIRLDKELELTYFCLEIEPCMMWMKFMKPLKSR